MQGDRSATSVGVLGTNRAQPLLRPATSGRFALRASAHWAHTSLRRLPGCGAEPHKPRAAAQQRKHSERPKAQDVRRRRPAPFSKPTDCPQKNRMIRNKSPETFPFAGRFRGTFRMCLCFDVVIGFTFTPTAPVQPAPSTLSESPEICILHSAPGRSPWPCQASANG